VKQHQAVLEIATTSRGFVDVTDRVAEVVRESGVRTGLAVVFCRHTSASLLIQENYDPAVRGDLARWLDRLAPEGEGYEHDDEGADDMPSHLKASLTRTSETIPVVDGRLALGRWQAVWLVEHRRAPHRREIVVHVTGE
jgi:secondary thiamine-phosphate synthase enzyme